MGLLDYFKPKKDGVQANGYSIKARLEKVTDAVDDCMKKQGSDTFYYELHGVNDPTLKLQKSDIAGKEDLFLLAELLATLSTSKKRRDKIKTSIIAGFFYSYSFAKADLTDEEFYVLLKSWKSDGNGYTFRWSTNRLFAMVCKRVEESGVTEPLQKLLLLFQSPEDSYMYTDAKKINEKIAYLLQEKTAIAINLHDDWGKQVALFTEALPPVEKEAWTRLLTYCLETGEKSAPAKTWMQKAAPLVEAVGKEAFAKKMIEWLSFTGSLLQALHKKGDPFMGERHDFLRDINHNLLKSLIWCAGLLNHSLLNGALDNYAALAYKKKPGTGPLSAKTGTACMLAFSQLPFKEAVTRLMKFRNRTTNNTILKSIDKIIAGVAEKHGYAKDLVEEIGVMDFGLDAKGSKTLRFDNVACKVEVDKRNQVVVSWQKDGKPLKAVPAAVKTEFATAYKELKKDLTELAAQIQVQKDRIEGYYLCKKVWTYTDWRENYLQHPLVCAVAGKLIWTFTTGLQTVAGTWDDEKLVNAKGESLSGLSEETTVELWHPINAGVDEVVAWRQYLQQREITQPFKQAFREVYLLTDAELRTSTYSNRFAAHVLRQHQFAALTKQRGWSYGLMGQWDSHNTPVVTIPAYKMMAHYYVDADGNGEAHNGIFLYIGTDQVRFYKEGELLELVDVPRLVFSEIMRDVDLFVGVTSIGNDPGWADNQNGAYNTYWHNYSFGDLSESAKMRSTVLHGLIPRLKIRDKCSFEGKFLKVKGALRTYKIHMGSGNILMEPNDQYLCIVPGGRTEKAGEKLYLPFEGDNLLSIIISKALMLAEDDKITDETIVRQIKK
jgi:hypothetical protein